MSRRPVTQPYPRKIVRRRSRIAGWGVYAAERITKNSRIIEYAGQKITAGQSTPREEAQVAKGLIWCFTINRRFVRDASVGGNLARFINHSCRPNCYAEVVGDTIWIRASRTIELGEELSYDYNTGGDAGINCRCRPDCEGVI